MLLFLDNFDSFTYNLVQLFRVLGAEVEVVRNDAATVAECLSLAPEMVVVGPGPGTPSGAGISKPLIAACAGRIHVLGVCLGHQAIGELFGAQVVRGETPVHGKTSTILHDGRGLFIDAPQGFSATRYHSLLLDRRSFPDTLEVSATTPSGEIMAIRHRHYAIEGVQFHPESVLTQEGATLCETFLYQNRILATM